MKPPPPSAPTQHLANFGCSLPPRLIEVRSRAFGFSLPCVTFRRRSAGSCWFTGAGYAGRSSRGAPGRRQSRPSVPVASREEELGHASEPACASRISSARRAPPCEIVAHRGLRAGELLRLRCGCDVHSRRGPPAAALRGSRADPRVLIVVRDPGLPSGRSPGAADPYPGDPPLAPAPAGPRRTAGQGRLDPSPRRSDAASTAVFLGRDRRRPARLASPPPSGGAAIGELTRGRGFHLRRANLPLPSRR